MSSTDVARRDPGEDYETLMTFPPIVKRRATASHGGEEVRVSLMRRRDAEHPDPSISIVGWVTHPTDRTARKRNGTAFYEGPARGGGIGWLSLADMETVLEYAASAVVEGYSVIERAEGSGA